MSDRAINGVVLQYQRAVRCMERANRSRQKERFDELVDAAGKCQAALEGMREELRRQGIESRLNELEELLPHVEIIRRIRIHDFHRYALEYDPNRVVFQGPIKLSTGSAGPGSAIATFGRHGLKTRTTGAGEVFTERLKERPLAYTGDRIICLATGHEFPLKKIVAEQIGAMPRAIWRFEQILKAT